MKLKAKVRQSTVMSVRLLLLIYVLGTLMWIEITLQRSGRPHQWEHLAIIIVVVLLGMAVFEVWHQVRESQSLHLENAELLERVSRLNDARAEMSIAARQELATWLHGEAQAQLLDMARIIRLEIDSASRGLVAEIETSRSEREPIGIADRCEVLHARVSSAIEEFNDSVLRRQAHRLYPPLLNVSLEHALRELIGERATLHIDPQLTSKSGTDVVRNVVLEPTKGHHLRSVLLAGTKARVLVPNDVRYVVYRVVEEAINNAMKHDAREITVSVRVDGKKLVCEVMNDGSPLPPTIEPNFGLMQVDSLVKRLHGAWVLKSVGERTVLRATIPVDFSRADRYLVRETGFDAES